MHQQYLGHRGIKGFTSLAKASGPELWLMISILKYLNNHWGLGFIGFRGLGLGVAGFRVYRIYGVQGMRV